MDVADILSTLELRDRRISFKPLVRQSGLPDRGCDDCERSVRGVICCLREFNMKVTLP